MRAQLQTTNPWNQRKYEQVVSQSQNSNFLKPADNTVDTDKCTIKNKLIIFTCTQPCPFQVVDNKYPNCFGASQAYEFLTNKRMSY